jgi:hypothetical protein
VDEPVELRAPLVIVPAAATSRRLNANPALREQVQESLAVTRLGISFEGGTPSNGEPKVVLHVRAVNPPVGMAFRAFLRSPTREWEVGPLCFPPRRNSGSDATVDFGQLAGFHATHVDVVLRPSLEEAMKTSYLTEVWGDMVVIKDVAVTWPPPSRGVARE